MYNSSSVAVQKAARIHRPHWLAAAVAGLILSTAIQLPAQEAPSRVLTLPEALSLAAGLNKDILKAKEYRNKVLGRYIEEKSAALPRLTVNASSAKSGDGSQKAFGGGLFEGFPTSQISSGFDFQVDQVLFTWGQVGAAIRAAREGIADADMQLAVYQQAVARDVSAAFYDVLLAKEVRRIAQSNLEQKERHLQQAREKFDSGTATEYDVLAADVDVQNARPALIRADNQIDLARERLRFLIGMENSAVDAAGTLQAPAGSYPDHAVILEQAIKNRPDLKELSHQENIYQELVKIYSAGNKPRLDFRGGAGYRHLDIGTGHEGGIVYQAGIYMTFPAWDGNRTKGKVVQAKSDLATVRLQQAQLADAIVFQVREALCRVREAGEVVQALGGTVTQAEKLLDMAEKGYEFGVKTKLEVNDAQLNLLQSQISLVTARRDYLAARVSLDWVAGTIRLTN